MSPMIIVITDMERCPYLYLLQIDRMIFITNNAAINHVTPFRLSEIGVLNYNNGIPIRGLI